MVVDVRVFGCNSSLDPSTLPYLGDFVKTEMVGTDRDIRCNLPQVLVQAPWLIWGSFRRETIRIVIDPRVLHRRRISIYHRYK